MAVCDQDQTVWTKCKIFVLFHWKKKYQEVNDFINAKLDVVSVCADTLAHFEIVKQLLESGVKIFS